MMLAPATVPPAAGASAAPGGSLMARSSPPVGRPTVPLVAAVAGGAGGLDGGPDALGGVGHVEVRDAERGEGVDDGVHDGRRADDAAGLADAFRAERVVGRG